MYNKFTVKMGSIFPILSIMQLHKMFFLKSYQFFMVQQIELKIERLPGRIYSWYVINFIYDNCTISELRFIKFEIFITYFVCQPIGKRWSDQMTHMLNNEM